MDDDSDMPSEALLRYPETAGKYGGHECICKRDCRVIYDGPCGCKACAQCFIDNGLNEKVAATYYGGTYNPGTKQ